MMFKVYGAYKKEATFTREFRGALSRMRILTFKINQRVHRGLPDVYFQGGNWLESKVIVTLPTIKNYPLKYFTANQRITMDSLTNRGDNCMIAILWYGDVQRHLLCMPWYYFRRIKLWDITTLAHFTQIYIGPASMDLHKFGWEEGKWNAARWKAEVFDKWPNKDNIRVFDHNFIPDELVTLYDYKEDQEDSPDEEEEPADASADNS